MSNNMPCRRPLQPPIHQLETAAGDVVAYLVTVCATYYARVALL